MKRYQTATMFIILSAASPVNAQDYMGQASDALSSAGSYAGTVAVGAATAAQTRSGSRENFRGTGFSEPYVRKQCAGLAGDRNSLGPGHRRVVRWTRICSQAGL